MMTKKILMLGSSIVCSLGICLVVLTLTSAIVEKGYANVEMPAEGACKKGASIHYCEDYSCSPKTCGTPSENCPCN